MTPTRRHGGDEGTLAVGVVILFSAALLLLALIVDGGQLRHARRSAADAADTAARAGAQAVAADDARAMSAVTLDPTGAQAAARAALAAAGAGGTVTVTADRVTVTATVDAHTGLLGLLDLGDTASATRTATATYGVDRARP